MFETSETTHTILLLLLVVVIALAGGRLLFPPPGIKAKRLFTPATAIYLALGVLLGERGLGVLDSPVLENLKPVLELALGWTGLLFGCQFEFRRLRRFPLPYMGITLFQSMLTMLFLAGALLFLMRLVFPGLGEGRVTGAVLILAVAGALSSPSSTALAAASFPVQRKLSRLIHFVASLDPVWPLLMLGLVVGYYHADTAQTERLLAAVEWTAVSVMLGLILGLLAYSFARHRNNENELLLLIIAFTVFSGGISSYLGLSSLFINAVFGVALVNLLHSSERIFRVLVSREKPIYIVFLVFVGASWKIFTGGIWLLLACFILLRALGKVISMAAVIPLLGDSVEKGRRGWAGLALLGQGGMSVALVANYQLLFSGSTSSLVVTLALFSVVINEVLGNFSASFSLAQPGGDR